MKPSLKHFLFGALLAGSVLATACVGYVDSGPDYYGPAYGRGFYYGHPWYHGDVYVGRPGFRHWRR